MRELGYLTTSGRTAEVLRQRAQLLQCDTSHFWARRVWGDPQLIAAIEVAASWGDVLRRLDLGDSGHAAIAVKARALQLDLDVSHLEDQSRPQRGVVPFTNQPVRKCLRSAAPTLVASWFVHRGYLVSFPTEPCPYDLVAEADGTLYRIQVKTATGKDPGSGAWICRLKRNPRYRKTVLYDPKDVDFFFIVDGDLNRYVVPFVEVAGQGSVSLSTLEHRKVSP
jgi:hypothetical protein